MLFVTTSGGFVDLSIPAGDRRLGRHHAGLRWTVGEPAAGHPRGHRQRPGPGPRERLPHRRHACQSGAHDAGHQRGRTRARAHLHAGRHTSTRRTPSSRRSARARLFGVIPNIIVLVAIVAVIAHVLLSYTVFGRWIYPTGGNYSAARAAGVPVRRVMIAVFAISGTFAAIGGVLLASVLGSARTTAGVGMEFNAISAVAIGGNSIFGGAGTVRANRHRRAHRGRAQQPDDPAGYPRRVPEHRQGCAHRGRRLPRPEAAEVMPMNPRHACASSPRTASTSSWSSPSSWRSCWCPTAAACLR